jgi:cephalosporin hydroxylase
MDDHKQFIEERNNRISQYQEKQKLTSCSDDFLLQSLIHQYSYNFEWMGLPVIQYPQDLIVLQEIIWDCKPDLIIETGIARGGSLVFYASMLAQLGGERKVIGIDVDLRSHNRKRLLHHPMSQWIELIDGSSIDLNVFAEVRKLSSSYKKIMVCLDSNHTEEHVLEELRLYAPLVTNGNYCVVFDTIIEHMPEGFYQDRPWDKGNNPKTAIDIFLKENTHFEIDTRIDDKLLVSAAKGGYLQRK